ncbi:MAG: hypothetical protein CMN56_02620 [Sneathiella sp.]|uniref:hypothetical protein n=1 Tax=Sneathiella sp. TaxID=1964365 RepID=UPI000C63DA44|nr:hypothetical protein [Sneathiella sp.]MAZ02010.1 hypothetical protein [Sneathiella sp.]
MFEKKLEEAAAQSRQTLLIFALISTVIGLVLVIALLFISTGSPFKGTEGSSTQITAPVEKVEQEPSNKAESSRQKEPTATQTYERQEVITLIGRYEQTLEPVVLTEGFASWNKSLQSDLIALKDDVVGKLASGSIDSAYEQVIRLIESASVAVGDFEMAFDTAMTDAAASYNSDDVQGARAHIDYALSLNNTNQEALNLKEKIEALPEVLELVRQASVARTENNLEAEKRFSEQIVALDPDRSFYRERITEIETFLTERRFEESVVRGLDANRKSDLSALQAAHNEAKSVFPVREETKNLAGMLVALKQKIAFDNFMRRGGKAMEADDWQAAQREYENASAIYPNNKDARDGLEIARSILAKKQQIAAFMASPERLSNDFVKTDATEALKNSEVLGALSGSLQREAEGLSKEIERRNRQIDILIFSDQLTSISVKGVGRVGQVSSYKIRLKPGSYVLEGKREGFKTKLVPITIDPDDTVVEVEVITDERI